MPLRMLKCAAAITLAAILTPAEAAPPDGSRISAQADWVIHIDVAAAMQSKIGRYILENHEDLHINLDESDKIKEVLEVDPFEVVLEVTVYGDDEGRTVALLHTTGELDHALQRLEEHEDSPLSRLRQGEAEIFSIDDGDLLFHVIRLGENRRLVVASEDVEVLGHGIAAAYGRGDVLGDRLNVRPVDGGLAYLAATSIPRDDDDDNPASSVMRHATAVSAQMAEQGEEIVVNLQVQAGNTDDAKNVTEVLQGLIALGRIVMSDADDPDVRELAQMLDGIELTSSDTEIRCSIRQPLERVLKAMGTAAEQR